jgi:hypothetical protein
MFVARSYDISLNLFEMTELLTHEGIRCELLFASREREDEDAKRKENEK